ncbi:MAG: CCA tRNA nucleotidyltransferase, partial [Streptococcaceae bacterium]|nr:CCA tRNA nucleotidyltransferase [Streptococcaceae bacterium]
LETEAYKYLPDLQADALEKLLSNITDDFIFQTSEQAWATLLIGYEKINVKSFLKKWKVSNDFMKTVSELVQAYHLSEWDLSALYRFGKANLELVEHLKVAQGKNIDSDLLDRLDEELQIHDKSEIVVSGNALIQELNIKAGPQLGQILKSIEENIVENKLNNDKNEIFDFVRSKFENL